MTDKEFDTLEFHNKTAKYFVKKLREYAKQNGLIVRSTSDLSPLEEWLLMELFKKELEKQL